MSNTDYTIVIRGELVHVQLAPAFVISLDSMRAMWQDVVLVCEASGIRRVLVEGDRPTRAMRKMDAYEHGWMVARLGVRGLRVAFCLHEYKPDHISFLFTVVASGGFSAARFFDDLEKAFRWLDD